MSTLQEMNTVIKGIQAGRFNARWADNAKRYVLDHDEGVSLILQLLEPHLPYIETHILLPLWEGCTCAHPDILDEFTQLLADSKPDFTLWRMLAQRGSQPVAFAAIVKRLQTQGHEQAADMLGAHTAWEATRQAVFGDETSTGLLKTLLALEGVSEWTTHVENDRPLPWLAMWAKATEPTEDLAQRAIEVLDLLLASGMRVNEPSPDGAACWALEELCGRYTADPLGVGALIEALLERGALCDGLSPGPTTQAFLDQIRNQAVASAA